MVEQQKRQRLEIAQRFRRHLDTACELVQQEWILWITSLSLRATSNLWLMPNESSSRPMRMPQANRRRKMIVWKKIVWCACWLALYNKNDLCWYCFTEFRKYTSSSNYSWLRQRQRMKQEVSQHMLGDNSANTLCTPETGFQVIKLVRSFSQ